MLDFQGHGYSEGERGLILSHEDLIDDLFQFIDCIYNNHSNNQEDIHFEESLREIIPQIQSLPYFIMGQSMGGGVISLLSLRMKSFPNYLGSVLLAPYLGNAKIPHWIIILILRYTMVSCFNNSFMPEWLLDINDPQYSSSSLLLLLKSKSIEI